MKKWLRKWLGVSDNEWRLDTQHKTLSNLLEKQRDCDGIAKGNRRNITSIQNKLKKH